jgi:hypothetical protein
VRHELEDPDALTVMVVPVVEVLAVEVVEPRFTPIRVAVRETWVAAGGLVAAVLVAGEVPAVSGTAPANAKTTIILLNAITFIYFHINQDFQN